MKRKFREFWTRGFREDRQTYIQACSQVDHTTLHPFWK